MSSENKPEENIKTEGGKEEKVVKEDIPTEKYKKGTDNKGDSGNDYKMGDFQPYKRKGGNDNNRSPRNENNSEPKDHRFSDDIPTQKYVPRGRRGNDGGSDRRNYDDNKRSNDDNKKGDDDIGAFKYNSRGGSGSRNNEGRNNDVRSGDRGSDRKDDRNDGYQKYSRNDNRSPRDDRRKDDGGDFKTEGYTRRNENKREDDGYSRYSRNNDRNNDGDRRYNDNKDIGAIRYKPRGRDNEGGDYSRYKPRGGGRGRDYDNRSPSSPTGVALKLKSDEKNKLLMKDSKKKSVSEMQSNPLNPLSSRAKSFEEMGCVPKDIIDALHAQGYNKPSSIQGKSIPVIIETENNLVAQSQSGTGKTACFAIGLLCLVDPKIRAPQAIVISPTLELARQNCNSVLKTGQFRDHVTVLETTKGRRYPRTINHHIICGTPGTILGLIRRRNISTRDIRFLVLDEADALLEQRTNALRDQAIDIKRKCPRDIRIFLFSATFQIQEDEDENEEGGLKQIEGGRGGGRGYGRYDSREDEERENRIRNFAKEFVPEPRKEILVPKERLTIDTMNQYWVNTNTFDEKVELISDLYSELTIGQSIIFINTKRNADHLKRRLTDEGHQVSVLHSEISLGERRDCLERFRKNVSKVLITTNVLSRGIDIPTVTIVINFDLPWHPKDRETPDFATYLHRIGRTARFGGYGCAVSFVENDRVHMIGKLEKYFNCKIEKMTKENIDEIENN